MQANRWRRSVRIACIALALFPLQSASASDGSSRHDGARETQAGGGYFVEFRARRGMTPFGHNYMVYGRLNAQGGMIAPQVVGFSDGDPRDVHLYAAHGHVGPLALDFTNPPTVIYRRHLTAVQFERLTAKIRQMRRARPPYHFIFLNCEDFTGEIAESIGLVRSPGLMLPMAYVVWLRALNGP
jgi:hypothetical protein